MNQVKEAARKADEMIAELARQARGETPPAEAVQEPQEPAPTEEAPEVESAPESDQGVAQAPQEPAPDPSADQLRESAAKWEQRYRSLDGMLQSRDRQIEQLHQLLADMQASKSAPAPAEAKPLITKEDEDTFGADLLDVARRIARDESSQYIQTLEARLAQFEAQLGSVATTAAESAQERFQNQLTRRAPNWAEVDRDPAFITWLEASKTRQRIFAESVREQDLDGVAQFYLDFEALTGKQATNAVGSSSNEPQAVDPRLARQVSPGKSRSTPTPATEGNKRQWTRTGIADFFVNRKKYPVEEANRLERDIFNAQKEGRVDYSH